MALVLVDRVQETTTTTGTGTVTLLGAVQGYQSFAAVGNANTTYYTITDGTNWEVGLGTYTSAGTTLSRTTVFGSSNAGGLVNFPAGTKNVFVTYPATKAVYTDSPSTFGFKNRLINGWMAIAQRATSATITAGSTISAGYSTVDRFYVYCTGANVTAAQVAGTGATKNRLQITGAASVTAVGIGQRIEQLNSYDLAGSTATLSLDISNSLLTAVTWTAYYANTADTFGTLASPTRTQIATGTFTVSSTLANYNVNISIPAAATTGIEIVLSVGAQTSGTWVVGNIQLEKGSTATTFDYRSYGTELALCQRYFEMSYDQGTAPATATTTGIRFFGMGVSGATPGMGGIVFIVPKRIAPTISTYDGAGTANNVSTIPVNSTTFTNGRAYIGAPFSISTTQFVHQGQNTVGNVSNFCHFTANAEL